MTKVITRREKPKSSESKLKSPKGAAKGAAVVSKRVGKTSTKKTLTKDVKGKSTPKAKSRPTTHHSLTHTGKVKSIGRTGVREFDSENAAKQIELSENKGSGISVETLKIGLLLGAIDGHCDENEIAKFRTIAKSCGNLSDTKVSQIVSQMKRRISVLESAAKSGATDDEMVSTFMTEAKKIGIRAKCRDFIFWMSIAMVDGEFSSVERLAIKQLQKQAGKSLNFLSFRNSSSEDISDIFLKRCEMILSGIYWANARKDKELLKNRMKSLQTLVEVVEA